MAYKSAIFTSRITGLNRQSIGFGVQMNFMQFMNKTKSKSNDKVIIKNISFKNRIKFFRYKALENVEDNKQFSVLSPFQRFIPISAFYPHFS